jgi:Flp pilus assembly protein TadB
VNSSRKPPLDQVIDLTIAIVLIAIGLSWAWHLVRPLVPVFVAGAIVVVIVRLWHAKNQW